MEEVAWEMGGGVAGSCPRKKVIEGYKKNQSNKTYMENMGEPSLKRKIDYLIREEEIRWVYLKNAKKNSH